MRLGLALCLSLILLVLSLACGNTEDLPILPSDLLTPTQGTLTPDGAIWVVKTLNGIPVIKGTVLTLSTIGASAQGTDGCNRFHGSHEDGSLVARPDGTMSFPGFGQTLVGCGKKIEAQGESYQEALANGSEYQVLGNRLEIRDGSGKLRLVMVNKSPLVGVAEDLTGTAWRLISTDGKRPRGTPPTLAFWDRRFMGGTVAGYGYVIQYDKWHTSYQVRTAALTSAGSMRKSGTRDNDAGNFLRDLRQWSGHAVREEDGGRHLRIRTSMGYPLDLVELVPVVEDIAKAEWRLKSFIEVRREEKRAGGPPCTEDVLQGVYIVARFTDRSVSGTVGNSEYSYDGLSLSLVEPGESVPSGSDDQNSDLPDGRCPRENRGESNERDATQQAERYLELLPRLRRYMIFGDRLTVLTDSQKVLLFQAESSR